jgi:flavodoxin
LEGLLAIAVSISASAAGAQRPGGWTVRRGAEEGDSPVRAIVIYFSQTGKTEKVARAIGAGIKQVLGSCQLTEIRQVSPLGLKDYDLIGIGFPVITADPANVGDFVNKMRFVGGKHAFAFCTHGTRPGFFWPSIYHKLKACGLVVIGQADWYGDCHLLHMPQPYPTAGHPDEIDLEEVEEFGREMALRSAHPSRRDEPHPGRAAGYPSQAASE